MTSAPIEDRELDALFALLEGRAGVGLAVSGGADSIALMHLAARWRERWPAVRPNPTVLTVDHGLRPESGREAGQVRRWARALGLKATVLCWRGPKPATGLQKAARQMRYDLLAQYARAHGLSAIVTAHHLDDQAETLLMRLSRGSGVDGLAAMSQMTHWADVAILRPLLDVPKARLIATLQRANVSWIEDPSNSAERFERTRIRRALAELARLGMTANVLALTARRMRRARVALDAVAERFIAEQATWAGPGPGEVRLPAQALLDAPEEVALRALARLLSSVGGQGEPPRLLRLEALLARLRQGGAQARTLSGCHIRLSEGTLTILRESGRRRRGLAGAAPVRTNGDPTPVPVR